MKEKFEELNKKFEMISQKGYIRGIYNSLSSSGRTFEYELGLEMNKECMPDYNGIEIKTRRTYSKSLISLFTAVPDGEQPLELTRLKDTYGYPHHKDKRYKVLYVEIYANKSNFGGMKYKYKLDIDKEKEKIFLLIFNRKGELLEQRVYWSFDYLKNKLINKLSLLAIVNVWPKEIEGWNYFNYYKIKYYVLKNFNSFIKLLENGKIVLRIKIDIYLDENNYGKMYDHGCSFSIAEKDISYLFYPYYLKVDKQNN